MDWLTDRRAFGIAVAIYGVSAVYSLFLIQRGFSRENRINYLLLAVGFSFHTVALLWRGYSLSRCPVYNLYEATAFIGWTLLGAYLVIGAWPRHRFLGALAAPLLFAMGVFALMPGLDLQTDRPQYMGGWLSLHVALFALAYGAFGLSSLSGLMYLVQEHDLKFNKLRALIARLPAIQRLESLTGRLLLAGFGFMTAALVLSFVWFKHEFDVILTRDAKVLWSLLVWAVYLGLVVMRWKFSHRGRRFAWGAIACFLFVLLTFWGTSWWSPLHRP